MDACRLSQGISSPDVECVSKGGMCMVHCPFAWVRLEALTNNIADVAASCRTKSVRIATKSVRSIAALRYIAERLPNVAGFMTFTAEETNYLLKNGFDDLLIGYPVVDEAALHTLALHVKAQKNVTFMVDCAAHVQLLEKIGATLQVELAVCIDVNISTDLKVLYFGTKRSPITSMLTLKQLLYDIDCCPHVRIVGCMAYDAQIAGVTDQSQQLLGTKSAVIRALKRHSTNTLTERRAQFIEAIQAHTPLQFVNGGGTGSMALCANEPLLTEITVGSAFFAPALFSQYEQLNLQPAAGFTLQITRQFDAQTFVCHGGGYVASGAPGADRLPQFVEPNIYRFLSTEGAGEVQTPFISKRPHRIGDYIHFRHAKAGELCERFNTLYVMQGNDVIDEWTTYRGDGQCFL